MQRPIRIGARGSDLALVQARQVAALLTSAHGLGTDGTEIRVIKTTGDKIQNRALGDAGGKGLFTKEIEEALLSGDIDLAVHSMKDVPTLSQDGLGIVCLLEREDVRDAFISKAAQTLDDLPDGAVIGTASLRRQAQVLRKRPDLRVKLLRGNVPTRLKRIANGNYDATFLAYAGLRRLRLADEATSVIDPHDMLPAVAQGAIGIETRLDDEAARAALAPLNHADTEIQLAAERAFLAALDGSCRTPLAALATLNGDEITLVAEIVRPDGSEAHGAMLTGPASEAVELGREAGEDLKARGGNNFFTAG